MKTLITYLRPYALRMAGGFGIKCSATFLELMIPYILEHMIDSVVPRQKPSLIFLWGGLMLLTALLAMVTNILANRAAASVARDAIRTVRHDLFARTMYLPGTRFDQVTLPSLISRMTADTYVVQTFMGMIQRMGVRAPIMLVGGILISSTLDPFLALLLLFMVPVLAFVIIFISRKGIPLYRAVQERLDRLTRVLRENITGVRVVKALSKQEYEMQRYEAFNEELTRADLKAGMTMALPNPLLNLFLNIGLSLVVLFGAYRVDAGVMKPGVILAFLTYFHMILQSVMGVNRIFMQYTKAGASAARIQQVLDLGAQTLAVLPDHTTAADDAAQTPLIAFENVSFRYPLPDGDGSFAERENCLSDISFSIAPGESLGIIGATGSGKSTLVRLLMRFYDVSEGVIRFDGKDIRSYEPGALRQNFGTVFQNDTIFADTLRENIAFGLSVSDEVLLTAADHAGIGDFIRRQPEGLSYHADKAGANLSGGQKQRILIARALARRPKVLILDDASSALDYRTDAMLRRNLREHYPALTTITIAQRISSIKDHTRILMLDGGTCIGYGTHEELLASCESYREIYHSQMGEGRDDQ